MNRYRVIIMVAAVAAVCIAMGSGCRRNKTGTQRAEEEPVQRDMGLEPMNHRQDADATFPHAQASDGRVPYHTSSQGGSATPSVPVSFNEAQTHAFNIIRQREHWPESPEAVSKAFWEARAAKNYGEMEVLWPGSASFNWPEICKNEPNVTYVFGPVGADGTTVPYAAKNHFDVKGTYNLTMRLRSLHTDKGSRFYITSGN